MNINKRGILGALAIVIVLALIILGGVAYLVLKNTNTLEVTTGNVIVKVDINDNQNESNNETEKVEEGDEDFRIVEVDDLVLGNNSGNIEEIVN